MHAHITYTDTHTCAHTHTHKMYIYKCTYTCLYITHNNTYNPQHTYICTQTQTHTHILTIYTHMFAIHTHAYNTQMCVPIEIHCYSLHYTLHCRIYMKSDLVCNPIEVNKLKEFLVAEQKSINRKRTDQLHQLRSGHQPIHHTHSY